MQARLKEIQDRVDNVSGVSWIHLFGDETIYEKLEDGCRGLPIARAALGNHYNNAQFIANAPDDIKFLLAALQGAQEENKRLEGRNDYLQCEHKRVFDNMAKYGQEADELEIKLQQAEAREQQLQAKNHDLELSIAAVRAANDTWKTIVTELREEIKQLKTVWQ